MLGTEKRLKSPERSQVRSFLEVVDVELRHASPAPIQKPLRHENTRLPKSLNRSQGWGCLAQALGQLPLNFMRFRSLEFEVMCNFRVKSARA